MNDRELEFAIFCIENVAERLGLTGQQAYALLAEQSDTLMRYIVGCYDVLHTQGKEYIVDDILEYLKKHRVAA